MRRCHYRLAFRLASGCGREPPRHDSSAREVGDRPRAFVRTRASCRTARKRWAPRGRDNWRSPLAWRRRASAPPGSRLQDSACRSCHGSGASPTTGGRLDPSAARIGLAWSCGFALSGLGLCLGHGKLKVLEKLHPAGAVAHQHEYEETSAFHHPLHIRRKRIFHRRRVIEDCECRLLSARARAAEFRASGACWHRRRASSSEGQHREVSSEGRRSCHLCPPRTGHVPVVNAGASYWRRCRHRRRGVRYYRLTKRPVTATSTPRAATKSLCLLRDRLVSVATRNDDVGRLGLGESTCLHVVHVVAGRHEAEGAVAHGAGRPCGAATKDTQACAGSPRRQSLLRIGASPPIAGSRCVRHPAVLRTEHRVGSSLT